VTDPAPQPSFNHDPLTAILVGVTELKGDIKSALEQLKRHDELITQHSSQIAGHDNRITALETIGQTTDKHHEQSISSRAAFWGMVGSIVLAIGYILTLWATHK
jgi:hypothetical protein